MNGYTKLFQSIITSTIWQEPNDCRVLWITMLALKDKNNICNATIPSLALLCNLSIENTQKYLQKFQEPDVFSRSQEYEGKRIKKVDGGFYILNGQKYQDLLRNAERTDYIRDKVRQYRANKKVKTNVNNVNTVNPSTTTTTTTTEYIHTSDALVKNEENSESFKPDIHEVFNAYVSSWGKAESYKLTPQRAGWIKNALAIHGKDLCLKGVRRFKNDPWQDRIKHNDLKYVFGKRESIDKWCLEDFKKSEGEPFVKR